MPSEQDYRNMMDELLEYDGGALTAWEMEFLDSLCQQGFRNPDNWQFTERQLEVFEKIWNKVF